MKNWKRYVAASLAIILGTSVCPPSALALTASELGQAAEYIPVEQIFSASGHEETLDTDSSSTGATESGTESVLYEDSAICVYHALQLYAIGTNRVVRSGDAKEETFGTGAALTDENGRVLVYGLDGDYRMMNDISMPEGTTWTLPNGFTGSFVSEHQQAQAPLYDQDTDTVYLYNDYQLRTLADKDAWKTVLTGDNVAETFGMGQVVYDGEKQLEYTVDHNYVVSSSFTAQTPALKSELLQTQTTADGRKFVGQVIYYENEGTPQEKAYILIGNEEQLRAIGSEELVYTAVYQASLRLGGWEVDTDASGNPIMLYGGDADLLASQNGKKDYGFGKDHIDRADGEALEVVGRCGVNQRTGVIDPNMDIEDSGFTYSADANYIIFRDIDLDYEPWTPLMFYGTMEGRLNMVQGANPTISKVDIDTSGELDTTESLGVGFFATITNKRNNTDFGLSGGQAVVKNISLDTVSVNNEYAGTADTTTLVSGLLGVLGGALGGLGDLVGGLINAIIPGSNLKLGDFLTELLDVRKESADTFATGAFAGRIIGDVLVEGCVVTGASVTSRHDMTGGFVGNVEGLTEYDGLSDTLGGITSTLEKVLNVIPGLGLGDLITVLLDNPTLVNLKELIPTNYIAAKITNCRVELTQDTIGTADTSFNGGFVGCQTGSALTDCTVKGIAQVSAFQYAGGFAGATRDALIQGLLDKTGVNLSDETLAKLRGVDPSAKNVGCVVTGTGLSVQAGEYAGGFTGVSANSDLQACQVNGLQTVQTEQKSQKDTVTTGAYAGGLCGRATLGSSLILVGDEDPSQQGLLGQVGSLLSGVLQGDGASDILNVLGVSPSNIDGCSVTGDGWSVSAWEYAGGLVGQGDGAQIGAYQAGDTAAMTETSLNGPASVISRGDYAGGIVGQLVPANAGGVVDSTLGISAVQQCNVSHVRVTGAVDGLTVSADGKHAGGGIGVTVGGTVDNVSITNLKKVSATETAGGFMGSNSAAGLLGSSGLNLLGWSLITVDNLLSVIPYFVTDCTNCFVEYTDAETGPQVTANSAGGFVGEIYGGSLDNTGMTEQTDAVRNISFVQGTNYAGGFAGKISSGSLVDAGGGVNVANLSVNLADLVSVLQVYIPEITSAGVASGADGLRVRAGAPDGSQVDTGYAGGYAGVISGAHISQSNVSKLATKTDFSHVEPQQADWAVWAPTYAGGYAGQIDIGSATAAGGGVEIKGIASVDDLLSVLDVVESRLDRCDVEGMPGGFNVQSTGGSAGGYAGEIDGSWLNGCDANTYEYICGVNSAGGYVGTAQPGNVASVIGETTVLQGVVDATNLLSAVRTFIPRIYNSTTAAVPCGGYIKATGTSEGGVLRGLAGGYAGYNLGGRIWGNVQTDPADLDDPKTPLEDVKLAATKRVRAVEGQEFAGGFTGLMKAANVADTGGLSLLFGLVNTSNLLSTLQAVYPTETNTRTTGPLRDLDLDTWSKWVNAVGKNGAYGDILVQNQEFTTQADLNAFLEKFIYGYTVEAKTSDNGTGVMDGGAAGGYVGRMEGGVVTNAYAQDVRMVKAYRSAGGFVGELDTATVANLGNLSIAGVDLTGGLGLVDTFVPVVYASRVDGYRSGMGIEAVGSTDNDAIGNAGGFVGACYGGQIWDQIPEDADLDFENVRATQQAGEVCNVKYVSGARYAGGFAGVMDSGGVAKADTQSESGLLSAILGLIISQKNITALVEVLNATLPTVQSACVNRPVDGQTAAMEYVVRDATRAAGGFVGSARGAILGRRDAEEGTPLTVYGLRAVIGGEHSGGFFGLADMGGLAQVANGETSILGILGLNNVDVLNSFRTYFYDCQVKASTSGLSIYAQQAAQDGGSTADGSEANQVYHTGNAGGFGGSLLNATVLRGQVKNLKLVQGLNYVGGFVGLSGKSGVVDVDNLDLFDDLLGASAGVLDIFGSHVDDSSVAGLPGNEGYTISSVDGEDCIAGGFVGYADLSRINKAQAEGLKQVYSDAQAGGFVGRTSFAYLAEINATSPALLKPVLNVVNQLLDILYIDNLEEADVINVSVPGLPNVLELKVLSDGDALSVTLLGLKISVALVKAKDAGQSDVAQIHIGDSYIELPCTQAGGVQGDNIKIGLIKANRTKVEGSTVTGISSGYDVYGGGAGNESDGEDPNGYTGGFVGYNDEGLLENNTMRYADTVRGTADKVGTFSGATSLKTEYENINNLDTIEGVGNHYFVYRQNEYGDRMDRIEKNGVQLNVVAPTADEQIEAYVPAGPDAPYDVYAIWHRGVKISTQSGETDLEAVWMDAQMGSQDYPNARFPVNVYISPAQADLMFGTPTEQNVDVTVPQGGAMQDPCADQVELTVEKIWYDGGASDRPTQITVTLYQGESVYHVQGKDSLQMDASMATTDPDIWTYTLSVPVRDEAGELYQYDVSESTLPGYITFYYHTDEDPYTLYILNFLLSELMVEDTVVIDYGLPVDVDVLTNDRLSANQILGQLAGVRKYTGETSEVLEEFTPPESVMASYGTAAVQDTDNGVVRYTPSTMEMDSFDRVNYVVKLDPDYVKNDQNYITGLLTVIPATEIFYEDNFTAITYTDGTQKAGATGTDVGQWKSMMTNENTTAEVQDTDRPGSEELGRLWDDWYGNDSHYENDPTYSNGTTYYVEVDENTQKFPTAEFTFTGTGFDLISVTSGDTGVVKIDVYDKNNTRIKTFTEDTYYGYHYIDGQWISDPSATRDNALYQIPIIKLEDLDWGTYRVVITATYFDFFDHHYGEEGDLSSYTFYLDAIRIYNPANPKDEDYHVIEDVYEQDGENSPRFTEIRDILINAHNVSEITQDGVVFVDGNGALNDIEDYEAYGPKNEVYLAPGQAISFYLWTNHIPDKVQLSAKQDMGTETELTFGVAVQTDTQAQWISFREKTYQVSTAYDLYYDFTDLCVWEKATGTDPYRTYRTRYPIVIMNTSQEYQLLPGEVVGGKDSPAPAETNSNTQTGGKVANLLSLTNLQWTGEAKESQPVQSSARMRAASRTAASQDPYDLVATASWDNVEAAYYLLNPVKQYTMTVRYQDVNGVSLGEDQVQQVYEGEAYDLTELVHRAFQGYEIQSVQGNVSGVATQDVMVNVIYRLLPAPEPTVSPEPTVTVSPEPTVSPGPVASLTPTIPSESVDGETSIADQQDGDRVPDTGDYSGICVWAVVLSGCTLALAVMFGMARRRKRQ